MKKLIAPVAVAMSVILAAPAQAKPPYADVVNTTCTYDQVIAAMKKVSPEAYQKFTSSSTASGMLHRFLDAPREERKDMVRQALDHPKTAKYMNVVASVAKVCKKF